MGGVVAVRTLKGEGAPSERVAIEGGSFGTVQGAINAQGCAVPGRTMSQCRTAVRKTSGRTTTLPAPATPRASTGGERAAHHRRDPPRLHRQVRLAGRPLYQRSGQSGPRAESARHGVRGVHGVAGLVRPRDPRGQDRRFVSENPTPGLPTQVTVVTNRRGMLDWQNTVVLGERHA